jgi:hypothetical protein
MRVLKSPDTSSPNPSARLQALADMCLVTDDIPTVCDFGDLTKHLLCCAYASGDAMPNRTARSSVDEASFTA